MIRQKTNRGVSFLTSLAMLSMIVGLVFVMLTAQRGPSFMASKMVAQKRAEDMADSAIALGISKLKEGHLDLDEDLRYELGPEQYGTLTFQNAADAPYSTNNIVSSSTTMGWKSTVVPPNVCHLVGVGHHHGLTVVRHALVERPLFPYSLAAIGPIRGESLEVFALPSVAAAADGITDDEKLPGHIVSNADGGSPSVELGVNTLVSGDVRAAGSINQGPAVVQGMLRPDSDPVEILKVNVADYDPLGKAYQWNFDPATNQTVVGRGRYSGNLTVGDISFADGLLYVDGDLTITGKISGEGAIVATGNITVTGSMNTKSDLAALVSMKDIVIDGNGPDSSSFQGMLYADGSVSLKDTTILGAAIAHDQAKTASLENVRMIPIPELTRMDLEVHVKLEQAMKSSTGAYYQSGSPTPMGIKEADGTFTELSLSNMASLKALGARLGELDDPSAWAFGVIETGQFTANPGGLVNFGDFNNAATNWMAYVDQHESNTVETYDVFKLDINTLLSIDQRLKMMFHTTIAE